MRIVQLLYSLIIIDGGAKCKITDLSVTIHYHIFFYQYGFV